MVRTKIGPGSEVDIRVLGPRQELEQWTLAWDASVPSDPQRNIVSLGAPVAKALVDHEVGDKVWVRGPYVYQVEIVGVR
jgi:transcription elongation GreA/GreB family factor